VHASKTRSTGRVRDIYPDTRVEEGERKRRITVHKEEGRLDIKEIFIPELSYLDIPLSVG
jgi:hypothetical protein